MTLLSPDYHIDIDGTDLATFAHGLEVVDGLENLPGRRLSQQPSAFVDGVYPSLDVPSFFGPKRMRIRIWVSPYDADGNITHSKGMAAHLQENMEALKLLLGGQAISNHLVSWTVPTPTANRILTNNAQISVPIVTQGSSKSVRRLTITLDYPWPFFRDATAGEKTEGPFTGAQSFTPLGSAPLADAKLTCTVAGRMTHDQTGEFVEVSSIPSGSVIIDQRPPRSITSGGADARGVFNSNTNSGALRFDANTLANLTITGTWQIDYFDAEH